MKQTANNFSFQIGSAPVRESISEIFLKTATSPTFPFLRMKIVEDETEDVSVEIRANRDVCNFLTRGGHYNDAVLYCANDGGLYHWRSDMVTAMGILSKIGIMYEMDDWISAARKSFANVLKTKKFEPIFNNEYALENSKKLLSSLEILDSVESTELLFLSAVEALKEKTMDAGTLIYKMAMAIYHAGTNADKSILTAMDDTSSAYFKLLKSPAYDKWKIQFSDMMNLPLDDKMAVMKVLIAFAVASYVYHKTVKGGIVEQS